ncbi:hypothetical protein COC60_17780 [Bacillus thuringiensis]|uniref:Uncharacterized protein n=1 Tax=Bacillus thuringiensis TaxID=1428 RepID=A0ABD6SUU9_BACTU|nr:MULTISPECIES: hypothetical protein [Bacillus]PDY97674.1 hypothetical protein CON12_23555 [Bacillus thuringiensis]PEF29233.1 hypothetical protein CON39_17595 [Bacillus thuringiensis]PES81251.1 hypothetical protein CN511_21035 [Bacillus thuringiensis]PET83565.1 hypothetical protein CN529_29705 [Bacillus thuringiensis]PEU89825.1 hypothetical protein CN409_28225 [Bacillus sp. AFS012607]
MKKIDLLPKPFFETLGEHGTTYFVYGYRFAKPKLYLGEYNSLKEARQFIYKYAHNKPQWLNTDGDINEYNNKPSRHVNDNKCYKGVVEKEYKKYADFKNWKK